MPTARLEDIQQTPRVAKLSDIEGPAKDATTGGVTIPGIPKPKLPQGLQPDVPYSVRSGSASRPSLLTGMGLPMMIDMNRVGAAVADNTESSGKQMVRGAVAMGGSDVRTPQGRDNFAGGASDVFRGASKMSAPVTLPMAGVAAVAAPLPFALGALGGTAGGAVGHGAAKALNLGPGWQNLLTDAGAASGGWAAATYGPDAARSAVSAAKNMVFPPLPPAQAMVKGLKPRNSQINFERDLDISMPEVKAAEQQMGRPISSLDDLIEATKLAKDQVWSKYQEYSGPAAAMNSKIDLTPVADAMVNSVPARTRLQNPALAERIEQTASKYRGQFDVKQAEQFLKEANSDLDSYYDKFPAAQRSSQNANPDTAHTVAEAQSLRDSLYNFLDQGTGAAREAKLRYGKLMDLEQTALRRKTVADRQAPESLSEQFSKWGAVGKGLKGALKLGTFQPSGALDMAEAWGQAKMAGALKDRNTSDWLVKNAFENYKGAPVPIPVPPPVNIRGLLGRGAIQMPPTPDTSGIVQGGPYMGRGMAPSNGMRSLPPPSPGRPAPLVTPPPIDPSGIVADAPNPYPMSGVMNRGQGLPMELVPWVNPETSKIEYVPRGWRDSQPPIPPRH